MPAINDWDDVMALWITVLMWLFSILLIIETLSILFGNDNENEKENYTWWAERLDKKVLGKGH